MEEKYLMDICNPKQWKTIPKSELIEDGEFPVYGANGIIGKYNKYNHEKPTVLITCRGATCGNIHITVPQAYINGNAMSLDDLNERTCKKEYLYYFLKYYDLSKIISGTAQPQITINGLKKVKVKLYSIEKQEKIVEELNKINKLIDLKKRQLEELSSFIKSQFVEMFGDPKTNQKGWKKAVMEEYIELLTDFSANGSYTTLDSKVVMYDEPNYAYMVRTIDLENKDYKNNIKYITKEVYEFLSKSKVYPNDIIMNKIGSAGKVYIMPDLDIPVSLGRNAFLIRFNDKILPYFIYFLLISEYGNNQIQRCVRGAVTKTITKEDVRKIKIIVPPIDLQNQFSEIVKQIDKQKFESMIQLKMIEKIYNIINDRRRYV